MKKYILIGMTILMATCSIGFISYGKDEQPELVKMRATAYPDTGNLNQRLPNDEIGEIVGYFDIEDTGSAKGAREGHVIDVWKPNLEECQEFMERVYENGCQGKVWVQFIEDAKG